MSHGAFSRSAEDAKLSGYNSLVHESPGVSRMSWGCVSILWSLFLVTSVPRLLLGLAPVGLRFIFS